MGQKRCCLAKSLTHRLKRQEARMSDARTFHHLLQLRGYLFLERRWSLDPVHRRIRFMYFKMA